MICSSKNKFFLMANLPPNVTTILQLDNPRAIQNSASSETVDFGGFEWRLEVRKVEAKDAFDLFVHCHPSEWEFASLWMCLVDFKICIQQNGHEIITVGGKRFGSPSPEIFFFNDYIWSNAHENSTPDELWNFNHEITFELKLLDMQLSNLGKNMPALDTTLCMEFDGKTEMVLVNKSLLVVHSNYFHNLFNGQLAERENGNSRHGNEFIIREEADFNIHAFRLMLNSAQLMGWMVHLAKFLTSGELAVQIVKMSIKYDVPMLLDYGEKHLTMARDVRKMEMLLFAEEFGLSTLKDHCLTTMAARDYTMDLDRSAEIRDKLSNETRQKLDARLKAREQRDPWAMG